MIKVKEAPSFGKLVDDILKIGVDKINSLEWKPYNVDLILSRKWMVMSRPLNKELPRRIKSAKRLG